MAQTFPVLKSFLSPTALAHALDAAYGISGVTCHLIKATLRDIYEVRAAEGRYIFALYRHGARTLEAIHAELDYIDHLRAHGIPVAAWIPETDGERLLGLNAPEGRRYGMLLTYIEGEQMSKSPDEYTVRKLGDLVARIHNAADDINRDLSRPTLDYDLLVRQPILALKQVLKHRPDDIAFLHEVEATLQPLMEALPTDPPAFGLIHGDVVPSNVIVTPSGELTMIDFDFVGYGWRVYDVASFLKEIAYWGMGEGLAFHYMDAYMAQRPLSDTERGWIPVFSAARDVLALGIPAQMVETWGSSYLSAPLVNRLMANLRESIRILNFPHP